MFYTIALLRGKRGEIMEKEERIQWVGKRALAIFRGKEVGLSNRLEQRGLSHDVVLEIARCVGEAISEFCKENSGLAPVSVRAQLEMDLFGKARTTEKAEDAKRSDRVRNAILSGGSDPASPAPQSGSPSRANSDAATHARIRDGLIGI